MIHRPVWLLSMDTEQFRAPPLTTGALKAHFLAHGSSASRTDVELVHFLERNGSETWLAERWPEDLLPRARAAVQQGLRPVLGLSCYTWNLAEFLEVARRLKSDVPEILVVAGGPHVQRPQDYVGVEPIDVVILGEGEITFTELLDADETDWPQIAGVSFLDPSGSLLRTAPRPRVVELGSLPSALDVVPLRDEDGCPLYDQVAYETSRGCPYRCAFCEWGTGAIGTKMFQFPLDRIKSDFERLAAGGIHDFWLCDSNFGALREDLDKVKSIIDLRHRTGFPRSFATSWSKNHNARVHEIVRLLHQEGLLSQYHLALQTLTPLALDLAHRRNMRANDYEPVVRRLAAEGIPVAAELIWGLPGDTLGEFETNLAHLLGVFPNINIFGYTLLPGTEFYERRDEYRLETIPVAGYGKARGEYVVGCHTFGRDEGEEGYLLIAAYIVLARGQLLPLLTQFLAPESRTALGPLLRHLLRALVDEFADELPPADWQDRLTLYERRSELYLTFLRAPERTYARIETVLTAWLREHDAADLLTAARRVLALDRALHPRFGESHRSRESFEFDAAETLAVFGRMERPESTLGDSEAPTEFEIHHPGGLGDLLRDPDAGAWGRGRLLSPSTDA